jgi:hypothetical protein
VAPFETAVPVQDIIPLFLSGVSEEELLAPKPAEHTSPIDSLNLEGLFASARFLQRPAGNIRLVARQR